MRTIQQRTKFKQDRKRCQRRGLDMTLLVKVVDILRQNGTPPERCRPHKLHGDYSGYWECHIAPDWLLIYDIQDDAILGLVATGTHTDLFG
ncbi:MAG: type II toxin-antitoxin system YafQ family toxin [Proteobacteria bacterium]|nr:type II toxin-antitoxin system YafQ family toxin [Pseudomonadota bacterium]